MDPTQTHISSTHSMCSLPNSLGESAAGSTAGAPAAPWPSSAVRQMPLCSQTASGASDRAAQPGAPGTSRGGGPNHHLMPNESTPSPSPLTLHSPFTSSHPLPIIPHPHLYSPLLHSPLLTSSYPSSPPPPSQPLPLTSSHPAPSPPHTPSSPPPPSPLLSPSPLHTLTLPSSPPHTPSSPPPPVPPPSLHAAPRTTHCS